MNHTVDASLTVPNHIYSHTQQAHCLCYSLPAIFQLTYETRVVHFINISCT